MKKYFSPKIETLNEFIQEMNNYNFKYKTKNIRLNLDHKKKKIYNINLMTNFRPKINNNNLLKTKSLSTFSFFNIKKQKNNNKIKNYKYDNIFVYKYKKGKTMNENENKRIINSIKDREKYLVRGLSMTKQEKKYFKRCLKSTNKINDLISEKEVINNNYNFKKINSVNKKKRLTFSYSLNNLIKYKFPLIIK